MSTPFVSPAPAPAPVRAPTRAPTIAPTIAPDTRPEEQDDDPKVAHITRSDESLRGYVEGVPIRALCGVTFVPSRNPDGMPVCQACKDVFDKLMAARGGAN